MLFTTIDLTWSQVHQASDGVFVVAVTPLAILASLGRQGRALPRAARGWRVVVVVVNDAESRVLGALEPGPGFHLGYHPWARRGARALWLVLNPAPRIQQQAATADAEAEADADA